MLDLFRNAGWVAWPLALCSVLALAIILERLFTLARMQKIEDAAFAALQTALEKPDSTAPLDPNLAAAPVAHIVRTLQTLRGADRESFQQTADIALAMQRLRLRRYLGTLATIGSTSPFIGLFGTVLGVMSAFQSMGKSGLSGETIASGISEALSATALGLLVAIPSVMAYNYFVGRVQMNLLQVQSHVARLMPLLHTANSSAPAPRSRQEV